MNSSEDGSSPAERHTKGPTAVRSAAFRAAGFLGFWLVLTGGDRADLAVGLLATVAATWTSLRLMPAGYWHWHPLKFAGLTMHFFRQSISAGIDVALRALNPRLSLRPGFVVYQTQLPAGTRRETFCSIMSLLPGTLPCGPAEGGGLAIHCLDVTQPVVEQLSAEEILYMQTPGGARHND